MTTIKKLCLRTERVALAEEVAHYAKIIRSSADVVPILRSLLGSEPAEVFVAVMLDAKNRVLGYNEVARGGLSSCAVEPAQVFRAALLANASGLILAHNHPSGDSAPSAEDCSFTHKIVQLSGMLGLRMVDHVIVGDPSHFSFLDAGLLGGMTVRS